MFKIFTLAAAIAVLPLSNKVPNTSIVENSSWETPVYFYNFKNTVTTNPFVSEIKPAETWSQNWMAVAQENIRKSEYHFNWEEKLNAYCTPNRKNNLRFFYTEKGYSVEPRTTQIPIGGFDPMARPDEIKYKTTPNWKVNFNLDKKQVGKGLWRIAENKAEYITDQITVQYINNDEGMRQNFIVHEPLQNNKELIINLNIKTTLKTVLQNNQIQFFEHNANVLNYTDLNVWDATGKKLQACFKKNKQKKYCIEVNTKNALYPITIDPLSAGTASTPDWFGDDANQAGAQFGISVSTAGDVNADGYSDVIIGAYGYNGGAGAFEGAAFIYHGSSAGLLNTPAATLTDANQAGAQFGVSVSTAGDVNGDGFSDVIVGANNFDDGASTDEGSAYVYWGSSTGIIITPANIYTDANQASARFGVDVACAGDVNGDGFSDVMVGAEFYTGNFSGEGAIFVYHGSATGLPATPTSIRQDADQGNARFGSSVDSAGDVNGDGYSDVIVGAFNYTEVGFSLEGRAFVYHGSVSGLATTPSSILDDANLAAARFGYSVSSAGDLNGDGYSDVIVGAYTYTDGAFTSEGRVFIYSGSGAGLSASPTSTIDDINQASAFFGSSVCCVGDVNGDGYSDILIGAGSYDETFVDEGRAFVHLGSSTGVILTPNSILDDGNQVNATFGSAVAPAGDVNGDGYSDVIIGCKFFDEPPSNTNEGRTFVYHGSASGISTAAAAMVESNQASATMGISVASAGDVNGDGYSDVIVGAERYDNGQADEGAAFVYHGSASGISTTAAAMVESNQAAAFMGISVASAGDINGDGYSDVIVGAVLYDNGQADEGTAFVYNGSASGISTTAAAMVESNQVSAQMGYSVASAGDVNGNGYSDVIVGAYLYDNGQVDEGAAFVYHGNSPGINKRNNLRLYNTNLTTPINSSNFIFGNFGAGLYAKSFLGKAKGKLVWETRLSYNAYSGTPITNSTFFTDQQTSYTDMGLTGVEIKNVVTKILGGRYTKLRARVKYNPVTAITGQVYGPWRNVSSIIDANNLGALPIELISFNAAWLQKGKTAKIYFTTDKESAICCFDIEKSTDGFNFYSVGSLPAKNVSGIQSYSFIDGNATGKKQFYRLKIKGIAGQIDYSNIQQLQNDKATEILVFPNPTTDVLQLQLNKVYDRMNVQIINSAGQIVKHLKLPASNQTITIPVQNLAAGKYWLHLQTGDEKQVLQFVKQ